MANTRDNFKARTKNLVAERSSYICTNPKCRSPTIGPHSDPELSLKTGEACHIHAAAAGGPRYDPVQSSKERSGIGNAIWLCTECSTRIDKDPDAYPAQKLLQWKDEHEQWLRNGGPIPKMPSFSVRTLRGLSVDERTTSITGKQMEHEKEHRFRIDNLAEMDIFNLTARCQLPEPVVEFRCINLPLGALISFPQIRMQFQGIVSGTGTITRSGPAKPINIHELKIDRIPALHFVEFAVLTSNAYSEHMPSPFIDESKSKSNSPTSTNYLDGRFQFLYRGAMSPRYFFGPLSFDKNTRQIALIELRDNYGDWKVIRSEIFN